MRAWELVSDVPIVHNIWGYICLVLCIIIPGSGTFLAACIGEKYAANKTQLMVGIFQLLTSIYIVGWAWSIWWGIMIVSKSKGGHLEVRRLLGAEEARSDQNLNADQSRTG